MDKLANENTFLQLFVSQLKNQDPLNPSDGTQFVSQLAQFSELEQVIGINQNVGAIRIRWHRRRPRQRQDLPAKPLQLEAQRLQVALRGPKPSEIGPSESTFK